MPKIDHILERWDGDRRVILGTVVDLRGSGYRRPGARILIEEDGDYVGAISGGCLEKDVVRTAWSGLQDGPQTVLFDTRANEFHPMGQYGTGCDGIVTVMLRELPFAPDEVDLFESIRSAHARTHPLVIAHVYEDSDGATVGAAAVWDEGEFRRDARFPDFLVETLAPFAAEANETERSLGVEVTRGGRELSVFIEWVAPVIDLLIVGAGADAAALAEVAKPLGWRVRMTSTDPMKLEGQTSAETLLTSRPDAVDELAITPHTHVVVMTHSLVHDVAVLPGLLASPARWVGLLGPRRRTARLLGELHEVGKLPSPGMLDKLHTPVGLDIGGEDPWEVGVSIVAQIIAAERSRDGGALSDRDAPIHPPHELRQLELDP